MNTATATEFAERLSAHADLVDSLADRVDRLAAEGLLDRLEEATAIQEVGLNLCEDANEIGDALRADYAEHTWSSYMNEAGISLGAGRRSHYGKGGVHYGIAYAIKTARNEDGHLNGPEGAAHLAASSLRVSAASLRVHAASCRVIAGLYERALRGEIARVG